LTTTSTGAPGTSADAAFASARATPALYAAIEARDVPASAAPSSSSRRSSSESSSYAY